jgi:hypothetical protein
VSFMIFTASIRNILDATTYIEQSRLIPALNRVEPRFTNLIRSWRPFVTRNVR